MEVKFLNVTPITMKSGDIPVGTVFTGNIGQYENRLFKKIKSINRAPEIWALDDVNGVVYWNGETIPVENYHPVKVLTVEV